MTTTRNAYRDFCLQTHSAGLTRSLRARSAGHAAQYDFSQNDYLGFAHHPALIHASQRATQRFGTGSTGSRLLSGDSMLAHALERRVARMKGSPRALVFSSGFVLNATVIPALLDHRILGGEPAVFCDRLVHASMYHGFANAAVRVQRYHHQNLEHLESLLCRSATRQRPRFIFTESIFGMDGDRAPIDALSKLAMRYDATLYVDEAHATGLFGAKGSGLAGKIVTDGGIVMGTFSKALGGSGAYLACNEIIADYLVQRCGGFIYSTAPAPANLAAALTACRLLSACDALRESILTRAARVRGAMQSMGFDIGTTTTHLIPAIFSDAATARRLRDHLANLGIIVSLIRPPTVPPNAARIRIAICASHDDTAIDALLTALRSF